MRKAQQRYGYFCACAENMEFTDGLHDFAMDYIVAKNITSSWWRGLRRFEPHPANPVTMPYNNFEVVDVRWWRSAQIQDFVVAVDDRLGIYHHRWGDAPLRGLAISLFLRPQQVRHFSGLTYAHPLTKLNRPMVFQHIDASEVRHGRVPEGFQTIGLCSQDSLPLELVQAPGQFAISEVLELACSNATLAAS